MTRRFDIGELLRVAVSDERSGINLYAALAKQARDGGLRQTFEGLVEQERVHERRFSEMLADLEGGEPLQYPDEYVDYLELRVTEDRHGGAHGRAAECGSDAEAVDLAIDFERDQLVLQMDIADALGGEGREAVHEVIQEERGHLVTLNAARKRLAR